MHNRKDLKPRHQVKVITGEATSEVEAKINEFLAKHPEIIKFSIHFDRDADWVFGIIVWFN